VCGGVDREEEGERERERQATCELRPACGGDGMGEAMNTVPNLEA
jgi:hypothetical protein